MVGLVVIATAFDPRQHVEPPGWRSELQGTSSARARQIAAI
jgi:hypothetical protein